MVVKVWESETAGEAEEDAMMLKQVLLLLRTKITINLRKEMPPCRQRSFVSSWPWDGGWMFW